MLIITIILILGVTYFFGAAIVGGYLDVKSAPREPMEWCPTHGHFRRGHCLPMADTLVCPRCYLDSIKKADKVELWKNK